MVLNASLLYTQHYKVRIKCKWSPPLHLSVVAIEKGAFRMPSTFMVSQLIYLYICKKKKKKKKKKIWKNPTHRFTLLEYYNLKRRDL